MMNFDMNELVLVNPCSLDDTCYVRSVHAQQILDDAQIVSSFDQAIEKVDFLVATSSIRTISAKKHLRNPVFLDEFSKRIFEVDGKVGLVFGREDYGLYNSEIAACDLMVKIPTSSQYPSLNLSHAVSLVLYSIYVMNKREEKSVRLLDQNEKNLLFSAFSNLLDEINYPIHKKEKTKVMFKRMMGRALPSKWEYHTLMGVLRTAAEKLGEKHSDR